MPSGASYVLVSQDLYERRRFPRSRELWPADRFLSLSPIRFNTAKELSKKLHSLASKKTNRNEKPRDRSKANTSYTTIAADLTEQGNARAAFEHQR